MMPRTRTAGIVLAFIAAAISGVSVFVNGYGTKHFKDATVYTTSKNLVAAVLLVTLALCVARMKASSEARPRSPRVIGGVCSRWASSAAPSRSCCSSKV